MSVAIIDLKPVFEYETVPRRTAHAYLKAKVKNTSPYALLAGATNIFLDNNFIAKVTKHSSLWFPVCLDYLSINCVRRPMVRHYALLYGFHTLPNMLIKPLREAHGFVLYLYTKQSHVPLWEVLSTYSGAYGSHTLGHSVGPLVLTTVYRQVMGYWPKFRADFQTYF